MAKLSDQLEEAGKQVPFSADYKLLSEQLANGLDTLHWSDALKAYADVGLDSKKGQIVSEIMFRCGRSSDSSTIDIGVNISESNASLFPTARSVAPGMVLPKNVYLKDKESTFQQRVAKPTA